MTTATTASPLLSPQPSLTFPPSTFAKLSPRPYLLAHLSQSLNQSATSSQNTPSTPSTSNKSREQTTAPQSIRPNGRICSEFCSPHVNTGSLTHAEGSAVVRYGDTTAVAGVRGEILLSKDIANHRVNSNSRAPNTDSSNVGAKELKDFDLLVPNIELATGCSPQFLPGQPPSTLAQSLSTRIYTLLHSSRLVDIEDLKIWYTPPEVLGGVDEMVEDDDGDDKGKAVIKAYWTLYIDIMFISLDGNPFDAAWAAALAALRNVRLPRAYWDIDTEVVLCSDEPAEAKTLNLRGLPIACTFVVFAAGKVSLGRDEKDGKKQWILADPDTFEEGLCDEAVTVVVDCSRDSQKHRQRPETRLLGISKVGGTGVGSVEMRELVGMAERRWREWKAVLESNGNP